MSTSTGTGTGTGTGTDGGSGRWPPITYPECVDKNTVLIGTLDGMPFDKTIPQSWTDTSPYFELRTADVNFIPNGALHFFFQEDGDLFGRNTTTGWLRLPGDDHEWRLLYGSTILFDKDGRFKMNLVLYNKSELIGCASP